MGNVSALLVPQPFIEVAVTDRVPEVEPAGKFIDIEFELPGIGVPL
jgi:hypothetical protein